jgi:hypothetical protein
MLIGRGAETAAIDRLLAAARVGAPRRASF